MLVVLGVLLVVEFVADKVPVVDSVNDWIQTVVRPASGGIVFGSGSASETAAVSDPSTFFESNTWVPVATGVVIALLVHLAKAAVRPALNAVTLGLAAPVVSTVEDVGSLLLSLFAILVPVLVVLGLAVLVTAFLLVLRRARRVRRGTAVSSP